VSLYDWESEDRLLLILFIRLDCQYCEEAQEICSEVSGIKIVTYQVFQSRIPDKIEIRALGQPLHGLPLLVDEAEIPEVPCLFDPILGQRAMGVTEIEKFLDELGLIRH
jgi:hypothetical protein